MELERVWKAPKLLSGATVVGHQNSTGLSTQELRIYAQAISIELIAISIELMMTALFAMLAYLRAF